MGDQRTRAGAQGVPSRQEVGMLLGNHPFSGLSSYKGFVCAQNLQYAFHWLSSVRVSYPNTIRGRKVENSDLDVERTDEMVFKCTVV